MFNVVHDQNGNGDQGNKADKQRVHEGHRRWDPSEVSQLGIFIYDMPGKNATCFTMAPI
jgi:hypothetical protein